MSIDPRSFNHPDRPTLSETDVAGLGAALLALTQEVWVLTDRLAVMEAVLARRGVDIRADIEAFEPDAEMQAELNARGKALVERVVGALAGAAGEEP
ncbi:MAG: hypothetical protein MI723_04070 [Caulobacterales bacterium]|nr:hypothetical protein [Caulobacterales bacterium]